MDLNYTHQRKLNQKRNMSNIHEGSVHSTYSSARRGFYSMSKPPCKQSIVMFWLLKRFVSFPSFGRQMYHDKDLRQRVQNNDSVIQIH